MEERRGRGSRKAVVLTVSSVLGLALAELAVRWLVPLESPAPERNEGSHRASSIPGLEYELAPSVEIQRRRHSFRTNRHGMRSQEVDEQKPAGVVRIAVVGDSFTFGSGVEDHQTYASVLQRLLTQLFEGEPPVEVLNFGVAGYSTRDEALVVRHRVLAFDPDVIVLTYVLNDPETHPDHGLHRAFHDAAWWERSRLLTLLAETSRERIVARQGRGDPLLDHFAALHADGTASWRSVVEGFADVRAAAASADVPVLLMVIPILEWKPLLEYGLRDVHERLRREGERNGFLVLDLLEHWTGEVESLSAYRLSDGHANIPGHRNIAEALGRALVESYPAPFASRTTESRPGATD